MTGFAQDDVVPTRLDLDIYYERPNEVFCISREARIDTQASADFISSELAGLLGHNLSKYEGGQFLTAAGNIVPIGQISPYFEWRKSAKIRQRTFCVIKGLPVDLILGIGFIREFQVYTVGNTLFLMALSPLTKGIMRSPFSNGIRD